MNGGGEARDSEQTSILIVDDLPEKHLAYAAVLDGLGPNIISVRSGAEALKQILRRDFAVILLDVNMPEMDGFETARLIRQRERSASIPIIFLTAFADEVRTAQGYATGAVDYLPTPVVPGILRAKVRVFVELFELRRQMARQAEENAKQAAIAEANRRLTFLADAGAVLGRSLDIEATARDIVRLPVPLLAGVSVLKLNSIVGEYRRILVAKEEPDGQVGFDELDNCDSLSPAISGGIDRVMVNAEVEQIKAENDAEPIGIILPLQARDRTFAVLALSSGAGAESFDANDIALAEAFSSRAAVALDNALLHEEIRFADRQKNDFLSMLAHELRNPLAPIRNAVQLLELHVPNESGVRWACEVIDRQIIQMVRLVDDLLDVARITRDKIHLHRQRIELSTVVEHAVEASRPEVEMCNHQLHITQAQGPIWIEGDLARLTQVFTNLLNNAAKFTEHGGQIWLTTTQDGTSAVIRIRDTGIGIPPPMLASVFNLFTQVDRALDRSHGGLGIGLTLVKRLVEMHDGTVEARSEGYGHGCEFIVRLPAVAKSRPETINVEQKNGKLHVSDACRILVVDDNRDSVQTLSTMLRLMGHETDVAYDGLEAVENAAANKPDVILLDIGLPKLNGYEVCRRIRAQPQGRSILIVALTGWGQEDDRSNSTEAGFDRHLVKPIDIASLEEIIGTRKTVMR